MIFSEIPSFEMISEKRLADGVVFFWFSLFFCLIISWILLKRRFFSFSEKRRAQESRTNAVWLINALTISEKRSCAGVKSKFMCKFNSAKICIFYTASSLDIFCWALNWSWYCDMSNSLSCLLNWAVLIDRVWFFKRIHHLLFFFL